MTCLPSLPGGAWRAQRSAPQARARRVLQGGIQPDKACSEHPLHDYLDGCIAQAVHDIEKTGRPYRTSSQRVPTSEQ
eukprot:scaffold7266_cov403-Prasinococcus_capsulatus_cf.AAC.10